MTSTNFCRNRAILGVAAFLLLLTGCGSSTPKEHMADTSDATVTAIPAPMSGSVQSLPVDESAAPPRDQNRAAYDAVVERIQARGFQGDYTLLRQEYLKTDLYDPFDRSQRETTRAMFEALDANELKTCVKHANAILERNYTSLAAHAGAAICYGKLEDAEQQELHSRIYDGLIAAIAATGNGKAPQSAFVVLSVDEIYDFLQSQDLEVVGQALIDRGDRKFDVMSVRDPRTSRNFDVYFDISAEQIYFAKKLQR